MDEDFSQFDTERLFALKMANSGYRICPRCGTDLEERLLDGHRRMVCPAEKCGFV